MVSSTRISDKDDPARILPPVLRHDLLLQIHALNADYLELVALSTDSQNSQIRHFAPKMQAALALLAPEHRARIAATPYTLYSLRFEDSRFWRAACSCGALSVAEKYALSARALETVFSEAALLQAWHISLTNALAARVLYAMNDVVRGLLATTPLWRIRQIAIEHPNLLMPRWPTNPCFWPDIVAFARAGDWVRHATTQLLGTQLIAAELKQAKSLGDGVTT